MPDLIERLRENPQSFGLFQAISLLERAAVGRHPVGRSVGLDEAVRLGAAAGFGFDPSDVSAVTLSARPGPALSLRSGALSLAGAQGPLPAPLTELLLQSRRHGDEAGLEFLDIFNQRLLAFLYRGRRKHHLSLDTGQGGEHPVVRTLDALCGLGRGEGVRGPQGERPWLRHGALHGAAPRSMASLLALAQDRLGVAFSGRQFVGSWQPLDARERATLGRGSSLAGVRALGARGWDQEAGITLATPPLDRERYMSLLPGGTRHRLLAWLVAGHQQRPLRVVLEPALGQAAILALSTAAPMPPRLGWSTWLAGQRRQGGPRILLREGAPVHAA